MCVRKTMFKEDKQAIRNWLRTDTDEGLAKLLAHAQDGKLCYNSCCCLVGVRTADHALQSDSRVEAVGVMRAYHLLMARNLPGALEAEIAFKRIGDGYSFYSSCDNWPERDAQRRRIVIPMIKAEMRYRERAIDSKRQKPAKEVRSVGEESRFLNASEIRIEVRQIE